MHDVGEFVDGHMRVEYAQGLGGNGRVVAGVRLELLEHGIKYVATKELALVAPSVIQGEHDLGIGKGPLPKQNPTIDVDAIHDVVETTDTREDFDTDTQLTGSVANLHGQDIEDRQADMRIGDFR